MLCALVLVSFTFFASGFQAIIQAAENATLVSPNGGQSFRIGDQVQVMWTSSNMPSGAVAIINLISASTNAKMLTLNPIPSSKTASFSIPPEILEGDSTIVAIRPGSYKIEITFYDKVPCAPNQANCRPASILARDASNNFFTVSSAQTSTLTAPIITSLSPHFGKIGTNVTINGTGFLPTGNIIEFDGKIGAVIKTATPTRITFEIPAKVRDNCDTATSTPNETCNPGLRNVIAGTALITVKNANGESDTLSFIVEPTNDAAGGNGGNNSEGGGIDLGGIAGFVATCAITSFAGNAAKGALSGIVGNASSWLKGTTASKVTSATGLAAGANEVPTNDAKTRVSTELTLQATGAIAQKEKSLSTPAGSGGIASGISKNLFPAPSLDALAFCIGNELIHYITQSTIQWINSGFQGKPVFIENSDAFFNQMADREAGNFIQELMSGSGINVCQPFRVQLAVDSIRSHTNNYQRMSQCSLSTIKNNYQGFMQNYNQGGLPGWFELIQDQNNIYGAKYQFQAEMSRRQNQRQNTLTRELNWSKGYKSFKYCEDAKYKRADGSCDPAHEKTGTPGAMIENTVNQRINSPQKRLEIADEFDELVSALVNALIKTAINEVLSIGSSSGSSGGSGGGGNKDTTNPTVSITAPTGTYASSTITVSANATDNIRVEEVQFKLDGSNFGSADKIPPYSIPWNTRLVPNGTHVLSATARDAEGNKAASDFVIVIVAN